MHQNGGAVVLFFGMKSKTIKAPSKITCQMSRFFSLSKLILTGLLQLSESTQCLSHVE